MNVLIFLNSSLLLVLAFLHFYWAFGGLWGIESAIPEKFGSDFFNPKNRLRNKVATLLVALGLIFFALVIASNYFDLFPSWSIIATRIIGIIFLLRAIGDFSIVGIFKKASDSKFARSDNRVFIPICLFLGLSSILVSFYS